MSVGIGRLIPRVPAFCPTFPFGHLAIQGPFRVSHGDLTITGFNVTSERIGRIECVYHQTLLLISAILSSVWKPSVTALEDSTTAHECLDAP